MDLTADKKYVFKVAKDATKPEIAAAVEELFKVDVKSCQHHQHEEEDPEDSVTAKGYTAAWKKAIVTLEPGSKTIEFFEGTQLRRCG